MKLALFKAESSFHISILNALITVILYTEGSWCEKRSLRLKTGLKKEHYQEIKNNELLVQYLE